MFSLRNTAQVLIVALALPGLTACYDLHHKPYISNKKMRVQQDAFYQEYKLADVDDNFLGGLAREYRKYGGEVLGLSVAYNPKISGEAMRASDKLAHVSHVLRGYGVRQINGNVLPVQELPEGRLVVSYDTYQAFAPEGCEEALEALSKRYVDTNPDLKLGCANETLMAKQIARPSDLRGTEWLDETSEGRAATNIVDVYRSGALNNPIDGESASGTN